jgi:hypothetical protein
MQDLGIDMAWPARLARRRLATRRVAQLTSLMVQKSLESSCCVR